MAPPSQRTSRAATAITRASTTIMKIGPKIIPDHPPPHPIMRGPQPYWSVPGDDCAHTHPGRRATTAPAEAIHP